ncbi:hypothetical protein [Streptomyces sp. NPDC056061]|uniref:hypothetical protein n=1 Tax=Streptomyces sp. NPDC056061 TaxID=3345700 RepID=UPI0035DA1B85
MQIPLPDPAEHRAVVTALTSLDELDRAHRDVAASLRHTRTALADMLLGSSAGPAPGASFRHSFENGGLL